MDIKKMFTDATAKRGHSGINYILYYNNNTYEYM